MTSAHVLAMALLAFGGQGGPTAAVVVRTPGAPRGDSLAVVRAVTQALAEAKIKVVDRGPSVTFRPGMKGARYYVEVTTKVMGDRALVDERVIDVKSSEMIARVSVRTTAPAIADSAAAAARRLVDKLTSNKTRPRD